MNINEKANELIQNLMKDNPNTKLSIGYLDKGETSFKLLDATGEIPYESYAYEIASISKVFTTSLLAKYLHEGKMNLRDSVAKYIPELDEGRYYPTLQRLATHTAGYQTEALTFGDIIKVLARGAWMEIRKKPTGYFDAFFMDYEKMIWFAKKNKFEDKDYDWQYADYQIALIGEAVSQVAGKPFDELMTEFLEIDLGLKYTKTTTSRADMLSGYLFNHNVGTMKVYRNGDYTAPAGGLTSTVEDMLKFARMNIEECPDYLGLCHKVYPVNVKKGNDMGLGSFSMGLGWFYHNEQQYPPFFHTGGGEGFSTSLVFIKELERAVVVLTNTGSYDPTELSNAIFQGNGT